MKKLIFLLLLLLITTPCFGQEVARMSLGVIGGQVPVVGGGDCPSGTYVFYWDGQHSSGNQYACVAAGVSSLAGTLSGAAYDTDIYHTASPSLRIDANNENLSFPVTTKNIFDSAQGYIKAWVYVSSTPSGTMTIMEFYGNAQNSMTLNVRTTPALRVDILSNNIAITGGAVNISTGEWLDVRIKWDSGGANPGGQVALSVNGGANWTWDNDSDNFAPFAVEPATILLGEYNMSAPNVACYLDEVYIYTNTTGP